MDKLYHRIGFENSPSKKTSLSEKNLNLMDKAIDDLDNRVIEQHEALNDVKTNVIPEVKKDLGEQITEETNKVRNEYTHDDNEVRSEFDEKLKSKADAITVEKSGTTIVATDSSDKGFEQFKTFGKSEQEKTSGKNKIPVSEFETNTDGYTSEYMNPPVLDAGKTYILSGSTTDGVALTNNNCQIIWRDEANNVIVSSNEASWTTGVNYGQIENAVTFEVFTTLTGKKVQIQLEEGNVATPYEHYTNGPTPNPEYPQPIVSAGQKLAEGNQLLPNGLSLMSDGNYITSGEITLPAGSYTFSAKKNNSTSFYYWIDVNGSSVVENTTSANTFASTFTLTAESKVQMSGRYNPTAPISLSDFAEVMLNEGSIALPYEPYTAGVKKAVDVGIQKKLIGKNQFNNTATDRTIVGATFTVNKDKSITVNGTTTSLAIFEMFDTLQAGTYIANGCPSGVGCTIEHRKNEAFGTVLGSDSGNGASIVLSEETLVCSYIRIPSGVSCNNITFKPMIREASITDDTYEPYTEQTLTINRVLRGIPVTDSSLANYTDENGQMWCADYADVERKVWVQRVKRLVFNGTESSWVGSGSQFNTHIAVNYPASDKKKDMWTECMSNVAQGMSNADYSNAKGGVGGWNNMITFQINRAFFDNTTVDNVGAVDLWKEYLADKYTNGTPVYADYILATPIETPMTDEEIIAYDALHTNKYTTIITNDAGCFMEVKYVADTKTHIAQNYVPVSKYTALEERVSALERLHV